ncbi:unnamed protein product [Parnassius mnemosyne]|uniref:Reverse transcriptase n=1 Tax=Parnassius mnemosyne TaxID=213953 RepID=A0AAV1KHF6_9NEOP
MDDILGTVDLGVSTDSEAMEQELRLESEQQLNQTLNEEMRKKEERATTHREERKEVLPKQFGMAKLLRLLNIENIVKMIYKSAYRVLIHFEKEESAVKLLKSEKLSRLGYRAQRADETTFSYGILRQIDLETEEKEILENLSCEHEIISIKRLRRMSDSGEWIDSETVRICFKGTTLPPYVYGYGCRFKVEPYTFPVSQCSGCWKFDHLSRSCPIKKIICPKCGNNHPNCDTDKFVCVNCKGPHMAMHKKCPIFLKEKEIRNIMTKQNCTYRKGLEIYFKGKGSQEIYTRSEDIESNRNINYSQLESTQNTQKTSYRDIVITETLIHSDSSTSNKVIEGKSSGHNHIEKERALERKNTEAGRSDGNRKTREKGNGESEARRMETEQNPESKSNSSNSILDLGSIFQRVKDICCYDNDWSTKFQQLGKLLFEILGNLIIKIWNRDDLCTRIVSMFRNGER